MKTKICVYDTDFIYGKRFCNAAMRIMGSKYIFMYFKDIKSLNEFKVENDVKAIITNSNHIEEVRELDVDFYYILTENDQGFLKEGKIKYIYKYQKINKILEAIDGDIKKMKDSLKIANEKKSKLIVIYAPEKFKDYELVTKKFIKAMSKKNNILYVRTEEYENFKGNIGFSNLIYQFKEDNLTMSSIKHEIINDNVLGVDILHSVAYPEDYNVINNMDFCNILNQIRDIEYEYVIVSLDESYVKNQYLFIDSDRIILIREPDMKVANIFKSYIKSQNSKELKKITEIVIDKNDKNQIKDLVKGLTNG